MNGASRVLSEGLAEFKGGRSCQTWRMDFDGIRKVVEKEIDDVAIGIGL
jgi:hypothetical protein